MVAGTSFRCHAFSRPVASASSSTLTSHQASSSSSKMIDYYHPNIDLTLLGCGFLGSYHLGAVLLLQQIWPHRPYNKICGASCGSLLGALLVAGVRLDRVLAHAMDIIRKLRASFTNPAKLIAVKDLVLAKLDELLPQNAHKMCTGRLGVSVTKLWSLENKFISDFESRADLIDAIAAGCFIPIWSGSFQSPKYRGERCIDGAYSDNMPKFALSHDDKLEGVRQISVSPFASELEVSPRDNSSMGRMRVLGTMYHFNWRNILRTRHAMLPSAVREYRPYLFAGHCDMKDYVLANDLIKCRDCYASAADRELRITPATTNKRDPLPERACLSCLRLLEKVDSLQVPGEYLRIMT